jgi:hypothetical protein
MNELVAYIHRMRNEEGVPLYFRRRYLGKGKVLWYVWYVDLPIAARASELEATQAVYVATQIHGVSYQLFSERSEAA